MVVMRRKRVCEAVFEGVQVAKLRFSTSTV